MESNIYEFRTVHKFCRVCGRLHWTHTKEQPICYICIQWANDLLIGSKGLEFRIRRQQVYDKKKNII
jgi:hypothetical protein